MIISIKATPNAKKPGIKKTSTGYEIKVDAPAEKGRANARLVEMLADYFRTKKSAIRIMRGHTSRNKVVEIGD